MDFSLMASDVDGYRRGSFGIGENESKVLYAILFAALVLGGNIDEERAAELRAAESKLLPKPPGMDQARAIRGGKKPVSTSPEAVIP